MEAHHDILLTDKEFSGFTLGRLEERATGLVNSFQAGLITAAAAVSWMVIVATVVIVAV